MFKDITADLNGIKVSQPNSLYPYRAYMETLLSFNQQAQDTRLICEGWKKDTTGQMGIADPLGANVGMGVREDAWDVGRTTELVGRPHLDIFQQSRLIRPGVNLHLKLVPAPDAFVIMSAQANAAYKLVIVSASLTIKMKQLTSEAELAHLELVRTQPMKLP